MTASIYFVWPRSASASISSTTVSDLAPVSITIDHPCLRETDAEYTGVILQKYYQCIKSAVSLVRQLSTASLTTEPVPPEDLKFCVDVDTFWSREFLRVYLKHGFVWWAHGLSSLYIVRKSSKKSQTHRDTWHAEQNFPGQTPDKYEEFKCQGTHGSPFFHLPHRSPSKRIGAWLRKIMRRLWLLMFFRQLAHRR